MRRRGSDQVGRWPWEVWLALVGASAGTVASFAAVGWVFLHAVGADGDAEALAWDQDRVVIEAEETTGGEPEEPSASEGAEPSAETLSAPEPEAATVEETPPAEPEPERSAEEEPRLVPVEPEPSPEGPREERELVPVESLPEHEPDEQGGSSDGGSSSVSLVEQPNTR
ncbi:hypothetical protein [Glycomyces tenuis]|uniref:hypothetical protein n=1 Tax=Glycomyces tenuis TaxID=58116 RepID=UPI0004187970|nr:hypothetical protein [Glycomyces tenuis]